MTGSRRPRASLLVAVVAATAAGACSGGPGDLDRAAATGFVPVTRVVDGDTVDVLRGGRDVTVRLIGIDAPEVDWYGGEAECYGARAGRFLIGLLDGERVRLEFDEDRTDPYDRTLAYAYLRDGRMVNLVLVRRGMATVTIYDPNDRYERELRAAQRSARERAVGLWSACR